MQRFNGLKTSIIFYLNVKYALPGATFAFSVFYPGTFNELEDSLSVYYKKR